MSKAGKKAKKEKTSKKKVKASVDKNKKKQKKKQQDKPSKDNHHAYLNEIGISSTECCVFNTYEEDLSRKKTFERERKKHSFDSRETWSLDYTLSTWTYEHLCVFKEYADQIIDLTCHEFDVEKIVDIGIDGIVTETVTLNEEEAIDLACEYLRISLTSSWNSDGRLVYEQAAMKIVAEIMPALWW